MFPIRQWLCYCLALTRIAVIISVYVTNFIDDYVNTILFIFRSVLKQAGGQKLRIEVLYNRSTWSWCFEVKKDIIKIKKDVDFGTLICLCRCLPKR